MARVRGTARAARADQARGTVLARATALGRVTGRGSRAPGRARRADRRSGPGAAGGFGAAETQVAGGSGGPATSPDLTEQHWQGSGPGGGGYGGYGGGGGGGGRPGRPWWRSWFSLIAVLVVLVAGGVAYASLSGGSGSGSKQHHGHVTALKAPGCSNAAAAGHALKAQSALTSVQDGKPFGVVPSKDGKVVFVITDNWLSVYKPGPGQTLTFAWHYPVGGNPGVATTAVLTSDGKYLLIAADNGIQVMNAAEAESGASSANVATLQVPGLSAAKDRRAIGVAVTPDGKYAFVSLQFANKIAVFNLAGAVSAGAASSSDYLGSVKVGPQPVGLAVSPDGRTLYATNFVNPDVTVPGSLSVVDVSKAVTKGQQKSSVISTVQTGCGPARIALTKDGGTLWVTSKGSDALLGYSVSKLRSDPKAALEAKVLLGLQPVGIALAGGGSRILVTDTAAPPNDHSIAVVNAADAMSGKPALTGYIASGLGPRELAISPDGKFLYVTVRDTAQVQVIRLSSIP